MPTAECENKSRITIPKFLGGALAVVIFTAGAFSFGFFRSMASDTPTTPPVAPVNAHTTYPNTEVYWQKTVAALHNVRFDGIPDSRENVFTWLARHRSQLNAAIAQARSEPTQNVDPQLLEMVQGHLKIDAATLELNDRYTQQMAPWANDPRIKKALENASLAEVFSRGLEAGQREDAPADVKMAMENLRKAQEAYGAMLHEIDIMQATLQERYRLAKTRFELPTIRPGAVK